METREYWIWCSLDYASGERDGGFSGVYYGSKEAALAADPTAPFQPYRLEPRHLNQAQALEYGAVWEESNNLSNCNHCGGTGAGGYCGHCG